MKTLLARARAAAGRAGRGTVAALFAAALLAVLVPGTAAAASQQITLNGPCANSADCSIGATVVLGTATLYADGVYVNLNANAGEPDVIAVNNTAVAQTYAMCYSPSYTGSGWNDRNCMASGGGDGWYYILNATMDGLQPGTTYAILLGYDTSNPNYSYAAQLSPNVTTESAASTLTLGAPSGYPPSNIYQISLTVGSNAIEPYTWTISQEQLGPSGAQVALSSCPAGATLSGGDCLYPLSVAGGGSAALTITNQQMNGSGHVYRYSAAATINATSFTTNSVLFANAPTFFVHRRTRGLFVTWPDEGNGAQYEVFGGAGGCGSSATFNSGLLPAGTTQWTATGLTPNTQYSVCMWAEIPDQPVTSGSWLPTWWVGGGNANGNGQWYTLPDVPGQMTQGGLLAAYYDVPSLASNAGPSEQVYGNNPVYTAIQGPIDFAISCNCTSSWPYAGHGGPMPPSAAGGGTAQFFGAKYLGWIYAPSSGTYSIGCNADDACQVWVNGGPVADGMTSSGPSPNYYGSCNACSGVTGTISLTAGTWYPLEVDYTQQGGGAHIDFYWTPPGGSQAPVPASDLAYPEPNLANPSGTPYWNVQVNWGTGGNPAGTTYSAAEDTFNADGSPTSSATLCETTANACTSSNLTAGSVATFYAAAVSGDGYWTPSAGPVSLADAEPPTVSVSSPSSIAVNWAALGNAAHYEVLWNSQNTGTGASSSGDLGTGATSYTVTGLNPNTTYYVWLQAWIPNPPGVNQVAWWTGASTMPEWTLANPPTQLQATGATNTVSFSWNPDGNPSDTNYAWGVAAQGSSTDAGSGATTNTQAEAAGLSCQSGYTVSVAAVNGAGVATANVQVTAETGLCAPPPTVGLSIDNGLGQTSSTAVTLDVQATDATYAQSQLQMRFSNDGNAWSAWQSYAPTAAWAITGSLGPNTVYVEVKDPDGGTGQAYASISYDGSGTSLATSSGVSGSYDGQTVQFVKSPVVTAAFSEPAGSVSMETSLDNVSWSQPQDAAASVSVVLPSSQGLHAVFAKYFNANNVGTNLGPDYFVLDTTPPTIESATWLNGAAATDGGSQTLVLQASDNITPASALRVTVSGAASWSGTLPAGGQIPLNFSGSGYVSVTITVTDQAGNGSSTDLGVYNS